MQVRSTRARDLIPAIVARGQNLGACDRVELAGACFCPSHFTTTHHDSLLMLPLWRRTGLRQTHVHVQIVFGGNV